MILDLFMAKLKVVKLDPILVTGFVICLVFSLMPVFAPSVLPLVDHPLHLALIQLASSGNNLPESISGQFETVWFTPYSLTYLTGRCLVLFTGVEFAGKLLLALYILLTPLAFLSLLKSTGASARYGLLVFPLLYNFNFSWGFLPFLLAIPILIWCLAAAIETAAGCQGYPLKLTGLIILLFFSHGFAFLMGVILVIIILLAGSGSVKTKIIQLACALTLPGILSLIWVLNLSSSPGDEFFTSRGIRRMPISVMISFFPDFVISGDGGYVYRILFWIYTVIGFLYAGLYFMYRDSPYRSQSFIRYRILIPSTFIALYLICPYSILSAVWLSNRIAVLVMLGLILLLPPLRNRIRTVLDITVMCLTVGLSIYTTDIYLRFGREAGPALECMESAEPGRSLRLLLLDTRSENLDQTPFEHLDQYYQIRFSGRVHNAFATLNHMPVRYRESFMERESGFRPEIRRGTRGFVADIRFESYDYFLMRFPPDIRIEYMSMLFGENMKDLRQIIRSDRWILLEKKNGAGNLEHLNR